MVSGVKAGDGAGGRLLLTGDIGTMTRVVEGVRAAGGPPIGTVNLGGIHHRAGRAQRNWIAWLLANQ